MCHNRSRSGGVLRIASAISMGSDAFISLPALYRDWLLDANIEDGLIEGTLDVRTDRPMPRIMPEPRYFSIPSTVVGAVALRNEALNWTPCVRSLTQPPLAWTNSPAEIIAAVP